MLDIVTNWGKSYYKMGSFLFYKKGQVILQSRVGIKEWRNFYYKMGGGILQSGAIITKKRRIVQKDSDNSVLVRATIPERKILVIAKSYVEVRFQTDGPQNTRKRSNLLFLHPSDLKISCLLKDLCYRITLTIATFPTSNLVYCYYS